METTESPAAFSFHSRKKALQRFRDEWFDLLIVGGGITGAAAARDAASRGLKVALVERGDFASGTSSRSSKLVHGGLRYLENFEFHLVFEALAERAFLLKSAPHMVRPLPFFLPVYEGDAHGKSTLSLGLWLYDLLALFRTPGFHRRLSRKKFLAQIPCIRKEGLQGGFSYYDASMWDDVLVIETLRAAHELGAATANYVEAVAPIWKGGQISGFRAKDCEASGGAEFEIRALRTIICAGPWTDQVGRTLSPDWTPWLAPSKGVHLIFDLKRIPIPGAMVMSHPKDGRISFVIPRKDFGAGVVIVGTTDGPTPAEPEKAAIDPDDVHYLMELLERYFPDLNLKTSDILSAYVGVRPLAAPTGTIGETSLQKLSREHTIGDGPGGTVVVAGGKYTTHRKMAEEIIDYTLSSWSKDAALGRVHEPPKVSGSNTRNPVNPLATPEAMEKSRDLPEALVSRYGMAARKVCEIATQGFGGLDPEGFPLLRAQLVHSMRTEMVVHLEDFYLRRLPLVHSRADHGLPWAEDLSLVWAREKGFGPEDAKVELKRLRDEVERRTAFKKLL